MTVTSMLAKIWRRVVHGSEPKVIYAYSPAAQGPGRADPEVIEYDAGHRPPPEVARQLSPTGGPLRFDVMSWRMARGRAKVLCIVNDGVLAAYGWIQDWRHFSRKYRFLCDDGVILGPYWTRPELRGRGLYGRLLLHSIHRCPRRDHAAILITTHPDNRASQRGIEKAGFVRLGTYRITTWCMGLVVGVSVISQERTLASVVSATDSQSGDVPARP
ncbi:MAG: GNAT family N-acetyltransferase [Acidobacteria bacterium]|nr:GNAT family N-acetyltransferase [Acidobacteriota bacterium]